MTLSNTVGICPRLRRSDGKSYYFKYLIRTFYRYPKGLKSIHSLEILEFECLDAGLKVSLLLEIVDVETILLGLGILAVHDRDLARLGQPLFGAFDVSFVDSLLDEVAPLKKNRG